MLKTVLDDCVSGFTSLYAHGEDKCSFLSEITNRTFVNMERKFRCPKPENLYQKYIADSLVTNSPILIVRANTLTPCIIG
jgi:hypothetical protein